MGPFLIHKERFLAAGTHFFSCRGAQGAPQKNIYIFEGIKIFGGHIQAPPFTKSWFNQPILSISELVKSLKLVCLIFFSLRGSFGAPENFNTLKNIYIFRGPPLSPPARKKCVPAARNLSLWMIKGPIIYLPNFFFV